MPLSWVYQAGMAARNWFFEKKLFAVSSVGIPVISVGNLTSGGSGKTPFVELLARTLQSWGLRPAILSRGYGRKSRGYQVVSNGRQRCAEAWTAGDEPAQMAEKLGGVIVVVNEDRVGGAKSTIRDFQPDVILLDDGFQHRSLARDLDIVLVTAGEVLRGSRILPAGNRREPWSSLGRADLIAVTKWDSVEYYEQAAQKLKRQVSKPMIGVRNDVLGVRPAGSAELGSPKNLERKAVLAVSGIANPDSFEKTLSDLHCTVVAHRVFPDHYWYSSEDLKRLSEGFRGSGAELLVTTEKDEARMRGVEGFDEFARRTSCAVVEVGASVTVGKELLHRALRSTMEKEGNT